MSRRQIISSIFFEKTVHGERCQLPKTFIDDLRNDEIQNGFFQHDNALTHTAWATKALLISYLARSPDLTPLDYFFFGHLKNKIYANRIHNVQELMQRTVDAIDQITEQQLINVVESMDRFFQ